MIPTFRLILGSFLLLATAAFPQTNSQKMLKPFFGQPGIRKKIGELRSPLIAANIAPRTILDSSAIKPLRFRVDSKQAPDKKGRIQKPQINAETLQAGDEGDVSQSREAILQTAAKNTGSAIWSNFLASNFFDAYSWPPDPNGDVGPSQVLVVMNAGIKVFPKKSVTDVPLVSPKESNHAPVAADLFITLDDFFSSVLPKGSTVTDPHIRYDRLTKRWFIAAIELKPSSEDNAVLLAVSEGNNITDASSFLFYQFNSSLFSGRNTPFPPFLDYPTLGVDKNSVLIGGNDIFYFGNDSVVFAGYVIDKKKLTEGKLVVTPVKLGVLKNFGETSGVVIPQGVQNSDPAADKSFFVGLNSRGDALMLATILYGKNNEPVSFYENELPVGIYNTPRNISTPGGLTTVDALDGRLLAASIHKNKLTGQNSLWTAHCIAVNRSGRLITGNDSNFTKKARNSARWYEIGNIYSKPVLKQLGNVYDAEEYSGRRAVQYFDPSVAANGQGHAIIGGTVAAYNEYLNVFVAGRFNNDPAGTTRALIKATKTTAIYAPYINFSGIHFWVGRWGDFSQTVVDPLDDQTIWTFQEYANEDDSYGVRAVQLKAPPPATPISFGPVLNNADTTITLEGISIENSGFFDPGNDAGGPGYNRLTIKSTGSIIPTNIRFINPTQIAFKLNTKNKKEGKYTLVIANPDGQVVTTDFSIVARVGKPGNAGKISSGRTSPGKIPSRFIKSSSAFPNPTSDNVTITVDAVQNHLAKIILIDVTGKQVLEKNYNFFKGSNQVEISLSNLSNGSYIAAIYNSAHVLTTKHIVVKQ